MRPSLQAVVDAAHAEALTLHRGWLAANCDAPPESTDYEHAVEALREFDDPHPDVQSGAL